MNIKTTGLWIFCTFFAIGLTLLTSCVKIQIEMVDKFLILVRKINKSEAKSLDEKYEDPLSRMGREQLTKITERGLDLPVALL